MFKLRHPCDAKCMNHAKAVCPRCKAEVHFERQGSVARCPLCGFQYELQAPPPLGSFPLKADSARSPLVQFIKVAVIVVLILLGTATLVLGVLFLGCSLKGFHASRPSPMNPLAVEKLMVAKP